MSKRVSEGLNEEKKLVTQESGRPGRCPGSTRSARAWLLEAWTVPDKDSAG